jgi:ribosomal-protein-alanine N-acetyltransferase
MEFSTGVMDREQTRRWIEWNIDTYQPHQHGGIGVMAIVLARTDMLIGQIGLVPQPLGLDCEVEITYRLVPEFWGRGIATEAASAVLGRALNEGAFERIVSLIDPANLRSRRVAARVGMTLWRQLQRRDGVVDVFVRGRVAAAG